MSIEMVWVERHLWINSLINEEQLNPKSAEEACGTAVSLFF